METVTSIKVECAEDCGNAPKKQLLKELSIAFVNHEFDRCSAWVTEDVICEVIGNKQVRGKKEFKEAMYQIKDYTVHELHIYTIITHGNTASVNGVLKCDNEQFIAFCNVYNFKGFSKNAKIKAITSYIIFE